MLAARALQAFAAFDSKAQAKRNLVAQTLVEAGRHPAVAEHARLKGELAGRLAAAERSAAAKGWRWIGEMQEIADTFAAAGQPEGFHRAAAEVYRP